MHEFRDARLPERFWSKVSVSRAGCWVWIAAHDTKGYGRFRCAGRLDGAHRVSYLWLVGGIAPGLHLDHLCRIPACVNPAHLEVVTPRENTLRGEAPPATCARKTCCPRGHELTAENTYETFHGRDRNRHRRCRECHKAWMRAYYHRKKTTRAV